MTGFLRLSTHVGYGLIGDRPIFLDLRRDRYLTLDGDAAAAFRRLRSGDALPEPDLGRLAATGLFERCGAQACVAPASAPPVSAQLQANGASAGIRDRLAIWRLLRGVGRELRSRPLVDMLAGRAAGAPSASADPARAASLAQRFRSARKGAPIAPRCLPDSIALWDWLRAGGARASIVFGARLDPFGAHCWVQEGRLAYNEAVDRAGEYVPVYIFP